MPAPVHLGLIVDGNRRWAKLNGLPTLEGHKAGYRNLLTIAEAAFTQGVKYLSVYAFSTENWNRSQQEVAYLMGLITQIFRQDVAKLKDKGIRLRWMGSESGLESRLIQQIRAAEAETAPGKAGQLLLCFNYGGRAEIAQALSALASSGEEVSEQTIGKYLYSPDVPDADLIIRTSGEQRLSNFMLWRAAYAEFAFTERLWPDFSVDDLRTCLDDYKTRQRRYGK